MLRTPPVRDSKAVFEVSDSVAPMQLSYTDAPRQLNAVLLGGSGCPRRAHRSRYD